MNGESLVIAGERHRCVGGIVRVRSHCEITLGRVDLEATRRHRLAVESLAVAHGDTHPTVFGLLGRERNVLDRLAEESACAVVVEACHVPIDHLVGYRLRYKLDGHLCRHYLKIGLYIIVNQGELDRRIECHRGASLLVVELIFGGCEVGCLCRCAKGAFGDIGR